jgi:hypothetical protein
MLLTELPVKNQMKKNEARCFKPYGIKMRKYDRPGCIPCRYFQGILTKGKGSVKLTSLY